MVTVGAGALRQDGNLLGADRAVSFTTQTAATVAEFQVRLVPPEQTADVPTPRAAGTPRSRTGRRTSCCWATRR